MTHDNTGTGVNVPSSIANGRLTFVVTYNNAGGLNIKASTSFVVQHVTAVGNVTGLDASNATGITIENSISADNTTGIKVTNQASLATLSYVDLFNSPCQN